MFTWLKSCLTLTVLLSFVTSSGGAEPARSVLNGNQSAVYNAPVPSNAFATSNYDAGYSSDCGGACGSGCDGHGCGHHGKNCNGYCQGRFQTRCNMIPHVAYINPMGSYYYFRPYQAFHVRAQQEEVITYGADPRQPYANLLFRTLYTELEAAWAEEAAQQSSPFEDEVPQHSVPSTEEETNRAVPSDSNTRFPSAPFQPEVKASPAYNTDKPANNTAALPVLRQGAFRSRQ